MPDADAVRKAEDAQFVRMDEQGTGCRERMLETVGGVEVGDVLRTAWVLGGPGSRSVAVKSGPDASRHAAALVLIMLLMLFLSLRLQIWTYLASAVPSFHRTVTSVEDACWHMLQQLRQVRGRSAWGCFWR